jgi:hypothetical protein
MKSGKHQMVHERQGPFRNKVESSSKKNRKSTRGKRGHKR